MRPVERGPRPKTKDEVDLQFAEYGDAQEPLMERIGEFCSYCERYLGHSQHVEHIRPKCLHPKLELE